MASGNLLRHDTLNRPTSVVVVVLGQARLHGKLSYRMEYVSIADFHKLLVVSST